jgi:MerR family copper efflux transcriptional regulator
VVTLAATVETLTIHEAAATTGWSARMLRYIERTGLLVPPRTSSGYRVYGPGELQRLRTLRELLGRFDLGLSDVAFAARLEHDSRLRGDVHAWLHDQPRRPEHVRPDDWLAFEQEKHERLLRAA